MVKKAKVKTAAKKAKTAVKKAAKKAEPAKKAVKAAKKATEKKASPKKGGSSKSANVLGKKHTCIKCSTKFYDLGKEDILCPKCGHDQSMKVGKSKAPKIDFDVDVEPDEEVDERTDSNEDFVLEDEEDQY